MRIHSTAKNDRLKNTCFGLHHFEPERKRIAGELHDEVCSKLAIIRFKLCRDPDDLEEVINLLDHTLRTVRNISHNLYSQDIEHISFVNAVRDHVMPLHELIKVEIQCFQKQEIILSKKTRLNLFRIFQEIINNILTHAQATRILICLHFTDYFVSLSVNDNGIGLSNNPNAVSGIGMQNINLRATALNARYQFISKQNIGTTFEISVPIKD